MTTGKKVVFQGEPGANSHLASREVYPDYEPVPCATFEDAFAAISSGEAELGMIPVENSVAGRVADIHHLMPDSGLHIIAEHFMPVRASAAGAEGSDPRGHQDGREPRPRTRPVPQDHPQARHQADRRAPIPRAPRARSRKSATRRAQPSRRALRPRFYGLDILAQDIEDEAHNTTRFIVLSRDAKWVKNNDGPVITTFLFRVRNVPAALYKALGGFATNGVNMTKLESYMIEGNFFATQFYADVEGHPEDRNLVFAFEELAFYSKEMKILGVYPAHPFRATFEEVGRVGGQERRARVRSTRRVRSINCFRRCISSRCSASHMACEGRPPRPCPRSTGSGPGRPPPISISERCRPMSLSTRSSSAPSSLIACLRSRQAA